MPIAVRTLTTVAEEGDEFVVRQWDIEGTVEAPPGVAVERSADGESIGWIEADHLCDLRCPRCRIAAPCRQRVEVYPTVGGLFIVHDIEAPILH